MADETAPTEQVEVQISDILDSYDREIAATGRKLRMAEAETLALKRTVQTQQAEIVVLKAQASARPARAKRTSAGPK